MFLDIGLLLLGFVLLIFSADKFVYGAAALARNFGLSPMFIGLTIVAMGSSAPEMFVSATAALQGTPDTAVGNALGSNITNIGLVLGISALIKPIAVSSSALHRELPIVMLVTLAAVYILWDAQFSFIEGSLLFVGFITFIALVTYYSMKQKTKDPMVEEAMGEVPDDVPTSRAVLWLIFGLILLPSSSAILVDSATNIAKAFGISDLVIGLTIIAIGTSLPELAASISSIMKGEDDMALGNILGSNIFNILAVLSLAGIIAPGAVDPMSGPRDALYMLAITSGMMLMCYGLKKIKTVSRIEGGLLLAAFIGYQVLLFNTATQV